MDKVGIIGVGNMGEAIFKAILLKGFEKGALLFSEARLDRAQYIEKTYGVQHVKDPVDLAKKSRYVVLAVKPQDSKPLIQGLSPYLSGAKTIISIMAGVTTSNILSIAEKPLKIIRLMPNICVKIGEGVIGIASNHMVPERDLEEVKNMLAPIGKFVDVGEHLMDAVTALGGSGPAFLLLFLEAMIDAGVKMGIAREKAKAMSVQVVKGTIRMLEEEEIHPTIMKEMITSPGGTTMAGLASLEEGAFKGSVIKAIEKAAKRAQELSL
jgi:pyrroline-5-carboxylate reductase